MWKPVKGQQVLTKEAIGRRIFTKDFRLKSLSAKGKADAIKLDVFLEEREGYDLSVDRVGRTAPDADVLRVLPPDCEKHAHQMERPFMGSTTDHQERIPLDNFQQ